MECLSRDSQNGYDCSECGSRYSVYHRCANTEGPGAGQQSRLNRDNRTGYTCSTCGTQYPITHRCEPPREGRTAGKQTVKREPLTPSRQECEVRSSSQTRGKGSRHHTQHLGDVFKHRKLPTLRVPEIQYTTDFLQDLLEDSPETATRDDVASVGSGTRGNRLDNELQLMHEAATRRYQDEEEEEKDTKEAVRAELAASEYGSYDSVPSSRVPAREHINVHIDDARDHFERRMVKVHRKQEQQHQNVWVPPRTSTGERRTVQIVRAAEQGACSSACSSTEQSEEPSNDLRLKLQTMSRKRERSVEIDEFATREDASRQKRNKQSCEEEVTFYKSLTESLREQNSLLLQKHDTLRTDINNLKETLTTEKNRAKQQETKLKNYRNAAMGKTLDRVRGQLEKSKDRERELENERNKLYNYAKKVEVQHKKATDRVLDLKIEYKEDVSTKLYSHYPKDLIDMIPSWHRKCTRCASPELHLPGHCVARGVRCKNCHKMHHLTATCFSLADIDCRPTRGEKKVLRKVAEEINTWE